ncbi:Hypothetical protein PHPALM_1068 [Phytophthora palmivora]|uniref:HTH CENPB-type domain-containing protein n=1 Tax=Phytophthora palmivora TaxID=4796 RepID=A0A2P4YT81_9STRA|nr:Hypothetical protein PHPALM_1068 [Phytophthora palmivora]
MTRPRTAGTGRRQKKYIQIAVDYTHKSRILDRLAEGVKVATVIEEFYSSISKAERKRKQKQMSKLKGQAGFIQNVCDEGKGHLQNYRRNGDATVLSAEAENDIVLWLNSIRKEGCPVSAKMLELKALEIAADAGIDRDVFSASYSWRRRFMSRYKLSIRARTRHGQTTPDDAAAAREKFMGEVRAAILKHNISNMFNADQTAVFFEYLPRTTIPERGQKTVWVKCSGKDKERATVMLLADWHGNKRAPFHVFKSGVSSHKHGQDINDTKRHGSTFALSNRGGRAKSWAYTREATTPGCFTTWAQLCQQLRAAFLPANYEYRQRWSFLACKQWKREVCEYSQEMRVLVASLVGNPLPEHMKVTVFMDGLTLGPSCTQLFRVHANTMEEAIQIVLQEEYSYRQARTPKLGHMQRACPTEGRGKFHVKSKDSKSQWRKSRPNHQGSADGARHGGLAPEGLGALKMRKSSGGLLVVYASVRGY